MALVGRFRGVCGRGWGRGGGGICRSRQGRGGGGGGSILVVCGILVICIIFV